MDFRHYAAMKGFEAAAYCRLCAEPKPYNLLVDLKKDKETRSVIMKELFRLKLRVNNLESEVDPLPKTVCNLCIGSLSKVYNFVLDVETAQRVLKEQVLVEVMDTYITDIDLNCATIDSSSSDVELIENNITQSTNSEVYNANSALNMSQSHNLEPRIIQMHTMSTHIDSHQNAEEIVKSESNSNNQNCNGHKKSKSANVVVERITFHNSINSSINQNAGDDSRHEKKQFETLQQSSSIVNMSHEKLENWTDENVQDKALLENDFEVLESAVSIEIKSENKSGNVNKTDTDKEVVINSKEAYNTKKTSFNSVKSINNEKKVSKHSDTTDKDEDCIDNLPISQLNLSWKDYTWECDFCAKMFPNINALREHSMQTHHSCNPYHCTDCQMKYSNLDSFISHVASHKPYLKLSCFKCNMKFCQGNDAPVHYSTHLKSKFICHGCEESNFQSPEELANHMNQYKRELNNPLLTDFQKITDGLSCTYCRKEFRSKVSLKRHLRYHKPRSAECSEKCPLCGKLFKCKMKLANHVKIHDPKIHECKICSKKFRTTDFLYKHVAVHDNAKPVSCDQCGKKFKAKENLKKHLRIHSDVKPYECNVCHKTFRLKATLTIHSHLHTGVKPFSCEICKLCFRAWNTFNHHMKTVHGIDKAKTKLTPNGRFPVDPKTGEVLEKIEPQVLDWKKKIMAMTEKRHDGRRKKESDKMGSDNNEIVS